MSDCVEFAATLDPELLRTVNGLAESEGRKLQSLIEEALTALLATRTRSHVTSQHQPTLRSFAPLYGLING
jgi:predicted component of type VI protein secretion system